MTQDERWLANWKAVMDFMMGNKRRPSKFVDELRPERMEKFKELLELGEKYRHLNQYQ